MKNDIHQHLSLSNYKSLLSWLQSNPNFYSSYDLADIKSLLSILKTIKKAILILSMVGDRTDELISQLDNLCSFWQKIHSEFQPIDQNCLISKQISIFSSSINNYTSLHDAINVFNNTNLILINEYKINLYDNINHCSSNDISHFVVNGNRLFRAKLTSSVLLTLLPRFCFELTSLKSLVIDCGMEWNKLFSNNSLFDNQMILSQFQKITLITQEMLFDKTLSPSKNDIPMQICSDTGVKINVEYMNLSHLYIDDLASKSFSYPDDVDVLLNHIPFVCLNHVGRPHRLAFWIYAYLTGIANNIKFTLNYVDGLDSEQQINDKALLLRNKYLTNFSLEEIVIALKTLTDLLPIVEDTNGGNHRLSNLSKAIVNDLPYSVSCQSSIFIVTETQMGNKLGRYTEKTLKPLAMGMPFVLLGPPLVIKKLRSFGFDLCDDIIDHSYDLIFNEGERFNAVSQEIIRLSSIQSDLLSRRIELRQRLKSNQSKLYEYINYNNIEESILPTLPVN